MQVQPRAPMADIEAACADLGLRVVGYSDFPDVDGSGEWLDLVVRPVLAGCVLWRLIDQEITLYEIQKSILRSAAPS